MAASRAQEIGPRQTIELRKIVYITNQIDSINFHLRKIKTNRGHLPDKDSAMKLIYLGLRNISSERGGYSGTGTPNWTVALNIRARLLLGRLPLCWNTIRKQVTCDLHRIRDRLVGRVDGGHAQTDNLVAGCWAPCSRLVCSARPTRRTTALSATANRNTSGRRSAASRVEPVC